MARLNWQLLKINISLDANVSTVTTFTQQVCVFSSFFYNDNYQLRLDPTIQEYQLNLR